MATYTTWNPSDKSANITLSNGDLTATAIFTAWKSVRSALGVSSGKWYWEITIDVGSTNHMVGVGTSNATLDGFCGFDEYGYSYQNNGQKYHSGSGISFADTYTVGDIIGVALDLDNGKIWWAKNGVWQASGDPGAGTDEAYSGLSGNFFSMYSPYADTNAGTANFGDSVFSYSVPSGFNSGLYEITDTEIILTESLLATSELQSNIQVEIVPGALEATSSISVGELFWGTFVELPSSFAAQSSLQAKTGLDIAVTPLIAQTNLQSNLQIELVPPSFEAQGELSVGEIFWGHQVELPEPFSANASLQANTQIELVSSPMIATGALFSNLGIEVSAGVLNVTGAILATPVYPIILTGAKRIYLFTLTGAADGKDDIIIPISSFQSRIKSGDPTYLSVVVPGTEYANAINDRLNGDLIVRIGYSDGDVILLTEVLSRVLFENITIYEGAVSKSITLDGHKTETWMPKTVSLENASYRNLSKGKLRYRCKPDLYLRPGDMANINDDSFTVESITYSVSPELETYEIAE